MTIPPFSHFSCEYQQTISYIYIYNFPAFRVYLVYSYDLELERTLACKLVRICISIRTDRRGKGEREVTNPSDHHHHHHHHYDNFVTFSRFIPRIKVKYGFKEKEKKCCSNWSPPPTPPPPHKFARSGNSRVPACCQLARHARRSSNERESKK